MKFAKVFFLFLFFIGTAVAQKSNSPLLADSNKFFNWLEQHEEYFSSCITKRSKDWIILCDNTHLSLAEFKKLFKMSPAQLVHYIRGKKVNLQILCTKQQGVFSSWCSKNNKYKGFKQRYYLQGQFIGRDNTILLRADALPGSLIHEYIHFLEFHNKYKIFNRRYKYQRVLLEKKIITRMDNIISKVKHSEEQLKQAGQLPSLLKEMVAMSSSLQRFSKFQDLIDERNIFDVYLRWGKLLGVSNDDKLLAQKNLAFICKRKDLKLGPIQCFSKQNKAHKVSSIFLLKQVKDIIKELRPNPSFILLDRFIAKVPARQNDLHKTIEQVSNYIFNTWKIHIDRSEQAIDREDNILPDTTLQHHHAHCVGLSTLFLLAFEKIGQKATLLRMPGHVLVQACTKKKCLWIETLERGKIVNKQYYITKGVITEREIKGSFYLKPSDLISSIYLSLGFIAAQNKQVNLAELFYKRSIDADRKIADAYSNLAALYAQMGKERLVKTYLSIALKINPNHITSLVNSAAFDWQHGKYVEAWKRLKKAKEINPLKDQIYLMSYKFHKDLKQWDKAFVDGVIYNLQHKNNCYFFAQLQKLRGKLSSTIRNKFKQDWKQLSLACPK